MLYEWYEQVHYGDHHGEVHSNEEDGLIEAPTYVKIDLIDLAEMYQVLYCSTSGPLRSGQGLER